jgi:TatD DNase family protein
MTYSPAGARLVDSHCHIDFPELAQDIDGVLCRMAEHGVTHALCVSVNLEDFPRVLKLAQTHDNLYATIGVHPDHQSGLDPGWAEIVRLGGTERVIAIGETGLDYYRLAGDLEWQRRRFRNHIRAARELGKPLVIHCREAAEDLLQIMHEEHAAEVGGIMHCFTESWPVAEQAMRMNFSISFSGIVTFRNAAQVREVAARVPWDRLLVETDSPYLAPVPMRGKTNEPAFVRHVAQGVAQIRGVDLAEVARITSANFFRMFNAL